MVYFKYDIYTFSVPVSDDRRGKNIRSGKESLVVLGIIAVSSICDWAILAPLYTLWFYRAGEDPKRRKKAFFIAALVLGITVTADFRELQESQLEQGQ